MIAIEGNIMIIETSIHRLRVKNGLLISGELPNDDAKFTHKEILTIKIGDIRRRPDSDVMES